MVQIIVKKKYPLFFPDHSNLPSESIEKCFKRLPKTVKGESFNLRQFSCRFLFTSQWKISWPNDREFSPMHYSPYCLCNQLVNVMATFTSQYWSIKSHLQMHTCTFNSSGIFKAVVSNDIYKTLCTRQQSSSHF